MGSDLSNQIFRQTALMNLYEDDDEELTPEQIGALAYYHGLDADEQLQLMNLGFWGDFAKGFKKGFTGAAKVVSEGAKFLAPIGKKMAP